MATDLRSVSLGDVLPDWLAADADVAAIVAALDPEIQAVSDEIEDAVVLPRIDELDNATCDALAWGFNLLELRAWDLAVVANKRAFLANIADIRRRTGTPYAVRRAFDLLGVTATIVEWWEEAAAEFTYRITVDATGNDTFDEPEALSCPQLAWKFAPASRKLTGIYFDVFVTSPLYGHGPVTVGPVALTFAGP